MYVFVHVNLHRFKDTLENVPGEKDGVKVGDDDLVPVPAIQDGPAPVQDVEKIRSEYCKGSIKTRLF